MQDRGPDRLLHALKAAGPQTATVLAEKLAITAVAVRQTLERLQGEGLVTFEDIRLSVGRPKRHWRLTKAGHGRFPDSHAGLTLDLITATLEVFGEAGLDRLVDHRAARSLANYRAALDSLESLGEKVERLAELRAEEGYMAKAVMEEGSLLLVEDHCPICVAATRCQSLCRSELAVFRAALGPGVEIERLSHIVSGARRCAYRISAAAKNQAVQD